MGLNAELFPRVNSSIICELNNKKRRLRLVVRTSRSQREDHGFDSRRRYRSQISILYTQSRFGFELTNRDWKAKLKIMPYRTTPFANGEFYHIYNRGLEKQQIFNDQRDYHYFIKALFYYSIQNPKPKFSTYRRTKVFPID